MSTQPPLHIGSLESLDLISSTNHPFMSLAVLSISDEDNLARLRPRMLLATKPSKTALNTKTGTRRYLAVLRQVQTDLVE